VPKSPIAAVIPIPQGIASDNEAKDPKGALEAISQIAAGVDAKPTPRTTRKRRKTDDPNGFLTFF
jgi:hypothetical protein